MVKSGTFLSKNEYCEPHSVIIITFFSLKCSQINFRKSQSDLDPKLSPFWWDFKNYKALAVLVCLPSRSMALILFSYPNFGRHFGCKIADLKNCRIKPVGDQCANNLVMRMSRSGCGLADGSVGCGLVVCGNGYKCGDEWCLCTLIDSPYTKFRCFLTDIKLFA